MLDAALPDTVVMLCDWRGRCVWLSSDRLQVTIGDFIWEPLPSESQQLAKTALSHVVTLREKQEVEGVGIRGERFCAWMWPLDSPEVAACILIIRVPKSTALLTERERSVLALLADGMETRQIAERLDVSLSTVHTHMRRAREKLELPTVEALISFAARYCYPANRPFALPPQQV